jgi:hypothetical protein
MEYIYYGMLFKRICIALLRERMNMQIEDSSFISGESNLDYPTQICVVYTFIRKEWLLVQDSHPILKYRFDKF